jgi:ribosome-associated protein
VREGAAPERGAVPEGADALEVNARVRIPRAELVFRASRAGGPGGQHVNTSSTRVEVQWNVRETRALGDEERERVLERLAARLDTTGAVRVVSSEHRSQRQNRDAAEARLAALVRRALVVPKVRRATKPTRASKERRLDEKRRNSTKKRDRRGGTGD